MADFVSLGIPPSGLNADLLPLSDLMWRKGKPTVSLGSPDAYNQVKSLRYAPLHAIPAQFPSDGSVDLNSIGHMCERGGCSAIHQPDSENTSCLSRCSGVSDFP